jgi:hypothetical protein
MADKSSSELLRMFIHIFGEVKHDDYPYVIRSDLHISVIIVGIQKCTEEAILEMSTEGCLASLLIGQELPPSSSTPSLLPAEMI